MKGFDIRGRFVYYGGEYVGKFHKPPTPGHIEFISAFVGGVKVTDTLMGIVNYREGATDAK